MQKTHIFDSTSIPNYYEFKDNDRMVKIPFYHELEKVYSGWLNCKIFHNEISFDFYKGYCLVRYIFYELKEYGPVVDDVFSKTLFSEDELENILDEQ